MSGVEETTNLFNQNYGTPSNFNMTIYSNGETKYYKLTPEQNLRYQELKDKVRSSYMSSFISSFLGFTLTISGIVLICVYYKNPIAITYILIALGITIASWTTFVYYLDYNGKQVANSMNELLSSNMV